MSSNMSSDLLLHKAVFNGDLRTVESILEKSNKDVDSQDIHGNTALHIAVMKGNKRCVELLVMKGAAPTIRNELNWMSLHEAISYGDFDIIKIVNDSLTKRVIPYLKRESICKIVGQIKDDFVLKFEVRLKDYKPNTIVGYHDFTITLTKKGPKIRADILEMDCFQVRPQNYQLIFNTSADNEKFITLTIGDLPVYQTISWDYWEQNVNEIFSRESTDDEIRNLMTRENTTIKMDWSSKKCDRPQYRKVVTRRIAGHSVDIYETHGIDLTTRTRTEHLRAREESNSSANDRQYSLPQPKAKDVSWEQYISAPKGKYPHLGRELIETIETNRVSIVFGLTEGISMEWLTILEFIQQILNSKIITFLTQLSIDAPKGFPVVFDLPMKASLHLKFKLISLDMNPNIEESLFSIPDHFIETVIFTLERNPH